MVAFCYRVVVMMVLLRGIGIERSRLLFVGRLFVMVANGGVVIRRRAMAL